MKNIGIVCEYNPFHRGHAKQIAFVNEQGASICLMSGNYVQRGAPAIIDKALRAKAAILCGADLVLELPVTTALQSAEGFAAGGVSILSRFCSHLCFGAENAHIESLLETAGILLSDAFPQALKQQLAKGLSFPAARAAALAEMGADDALLQTPNNILAVEYCKAILAQCSQMQILPIHREGNYHDTAPDPENPSATSIRAEMLQPGDWRSFVPNEAAACFENATLHTLAAGQRAVLSKLRTMTEKEFEALPYGSEGLWRKLMHAARKEATLEDIVAATKSKRYTRTRLDRMILCAFLGITAEMLASPPPYVRVLALNTKGRALLNLARQTGDFPNIGQLLDNPYQQLENRCGDLYGLFSTQSPEVTQEASQRIFYLN